MDNAAIADRLSQLAAAREADTTIPARARAIRAGHYTAAAVAARAATVELAGLDAAGIKDALGCKDKIAAVVTRLVQRAELATGIVALVEAGQIAPEHVADTAATLADFLALDGELISAELRDRVEAAIAALQTPAAPAPCGCQFRRAGHGRSLNCSSDTRRYAVSVYEAATDTYETYAACWACARRTVRLARQVANYPACSEVPGTVRHPAPRQYGHLVAHTGGAA